ncbi:MAG: MerR family transcriptional regulator [Pseudomonadota bacterium]
MNDRASKTELIVLPAIPAKRYFTIGEVSELCGVKPHVLRYWEQEFTQLKPVKRRGNRRYYQHHEVLLIRRIRELLYEQGFTISGARNKLDSRSVESITGVLDSAGAFDAASEPVLPEAAGPSYAVLRSELNAILALLKTAA